MKRRNFLKLSGLVVASGAMTSFKSVNAFSKVLKNSTDNFSLEAVVKDSDSALKLLEEFAKSGKLYDGLIKYSEYPITGEAIGDLIYVKENKLVDYTKSFDDTSTALREIRSKLGLPAKLYNPVKIRLYRNDGGAAKKLYVVQRGNIIDSISPSVNLTTSYYGKNGKFILKVNDGVTSVTETECRHQICKKMKSIKNAGDYITCIPNELHVFAE